MLGLWKSDLLEDLEKNLNKGTRKIMLWVKKHKYKFVELDKSQEKNFFNVNTQEEWNTAKNI